MTKLLLATLPLVLITGCASVPISAPSKADATMSAGGATISWHLPSLESTKLLVEKSAGGSMFEKLVDLEGSATSYTDGAANMGDRYRLLAYDDDPMGGTYTGVFTAK